jgi:hypothetical protein
MVVFLLVVSSVPALGLVWLLWANWRLRRIKAPGWQRALLASMVVANVVGFVWLLSSRIFEVGSDVPLALLVSTFVWHILVLPAVVALSLLLLLGEGSLWAFRTLNPKTKASITPNSPPAHAPTGAPAPSLLSRRQVLAASVFAAPVAMQSAAVTAGLMQLDALRTRELLVKVPQLPIDFEGFTIAHITDTHVGRFTYGETLAMIIRRVNDVQADCIVHTGDLINDSLEDMRPACDMLSQLRSVHGTFIVEGNHDLFESRTKFAQLLRTQAMRDAKVQLLLNESATIERGSGRLQLLGLQWGNPNTEDIRQDRARGPMLSEHASAIDALRDPRATQVLLAHHPDAFDHALQRNIPLTLAGHTHGGQLNLLPGFGPASATYRYLSGLYTKPAADASLASCVVGNGTGNWFPLRINAPAEIIVIKLTRG